MSQRCMGCMKEFEDGINICPHCGYVVGTTVEEAIHMEPGTVFHDRYIIGKVLGFGGFGVTYIAWDGKLEQRVAIKEYLPGEFSTRVPGQSTVTVFSGDKSEQFQSGLDKFIEEARKLAKFQNEEGIVKIYDTFKDNSTAYIVMEYLDGMTVTEYLKQVGTVPEYDAIQMLLPVMKSLQSVHQEGILHRDIAPDNIFITKKGECKLIDFGAARFATTTYSRSLTVIVKPGYSPEEQYRSRGDQGTYTDVYSLSATLYKMITGATPPDAMVRRAKYENENKDILKEPHKILKKISPSTEVALLNAMNVRIEDRTPNINSFIEELESDPPAKRRYGKIKKLDFYQWPAWLKAMVGCVGTAVIVFGILLLTGVISFKSSYTKEIIIPNNVVEVPNVEGQSLDYAIKLIKEGKLIANGSENVQSDYIDAGVVVLQDPPQGSYMEINGTVNLVVSSGNGDIEGPDKDGNSIVPYVILDTKKDALEKLNKAGFTNIVVEEEYSDDIAEGKVMEQNLTAGEKTKYTTEIVIVISKGSKGFEMPNVCNISLEKATKKLQGLGLTVDIAFGHKEGVKVGDVYKQSVAKGKLVKKGQKITITVCNDKTNVKVPDVKGLNVDVAKKKLEEKGFKVTVLENVSDVAEDTVISQTPEANSEQEKGREVIIYVSKGRNQQTVQPPTEEEKTVEKTTEKQTKKPTEKPTKSKTEKPTRKQTQKESDVPTTTENITTTKKINEWSEWTEDSAKVSNSSYEYETKTQYATREKQTTTSTASSLSGWTRDDSKTTVNWSGNISWYDNKQSTSSTFRYYGDKQVYVGVQTYLYRYYSASQNLFSTYKRDSSYAEDGYWVNSYYSYDKWHSGQDLYMSNEITSMGRSDYPCWKGSTRNSYKTQYGYESGTTIYAYYKYTDWSSWIDGSKIASNTVKVRTLYRYRLK